VNIALFCTIFEVLDVEEYCDLKSDPKLSFWCCSVGLSFFNSTLRASGKAVRWCVKVVQGHSMSSKFVPIKSPYVMFY